MTIKNLSKEDRPREKLLYKGPESLSDSELIAILLRTGVKGKSAIQLGEELLKTFGGLKSLFSAPFSEITKIKGIDKAKSTSLFSAIELSRRVIKYSSNANNPILGPKDVFDRIKSEFINTNKEIFIALYLNSKNIVILEEKLGSGTFSSCLCHPQEFLRGFFKTGSSRLILVHNHPSGDLKPSKQDINFTKELSTHLEYFGFELLDHIIISGEKFCSLKESGNI
ncbi:MAG: DNA repair protein RadC [Proteobacteria bacterium]|nr:DNA repair protein RadC [Pseudomonadota bacterium]